MVRFFLIAGFLAFIPPAFAEGYGPGTVGYFYENCQKALEQSQTLTELQSSICGAFAEGYAGGAMVVSSAIITSKIAKEDACGEEKQKEYDRINARVCPNLPKPDLKKHTAGDVIAMTADVLNRWISFEKAKGKSDPMKRSATRQMNSIIVPGKFCDTLAKSEVPQTNLSINPALQKIKVNDFLTTRKNVSLAAKYEQCKKDVESAKGDSAAFSGTRCGAEISGFIAGLHSTAHLQKNRVTPSKQCKKEIDRLYKNFDVAQTMCVTYDTNPLWVAEVFLKRFPDRPKDKSPNVFGAVGYETIYKGFLCAEDRKGN